MDGRNIREMRSIPLRIVESPSASLLLIALAADVIAADARFNHWVSTSGNESLDEESMLALIDSYEDLATACRRAVDNFERTHEEASLRATLGESLRWLREATPPVSAAELETPSPDGRVR